MKHFLRNAAMFLLLCICGSAHAQMKVESFNVMENDLDARTNYPLADKTASKKNQFCAIIKVVTTEMDCSYDIGSLEIAKIVKKPAEVWVYVPVGTMKIKISHPRQGQLDTEDGYFKFPERCKSGTVYRLKLHTEFHPDEDIIKDENKFATVSFNVFPRNAKVILRKLPEFTDDNGKLEKTMPLGIYHYRVSVDNYHYYDGQFELNDEGKTQNVSVCLRQAFGWAVLPANFDMQGCQFSVNGKKCVVAGNRIAIPSGQQKLHITKTYYYPQDIDVVIEDSIESPLALTMRPILGKLMVNTPELPGSTVKIDGKVMGTTPFAAAQDIIIGRHTIEVSRPNYVSYTKDVEIFEGKTETLNLSLTSMGNFLVSSSPTGASLYINNKYIGITPCSMTDLASGDYSIRLEKNKYHTFKKQVHLDAANPNNSFSLNYQYQKKNQIYIAPSFQAGSLMAFGVTLGGYIYNFNVEASYLLCFGKSEGLYWNRDHTVFVDENPRQSPLICEYKPMAFGFKLGYGIILGTRMRLTPQFGATIVNIKGNAVRLSDDSKETSKCNVVSGTIGVRFDYVVVNHLGLFVAPEYDFAIKKSPIFEQVSVVSSKVSGWGNGFNARVGVSVFF